MNGLLGRFVFVAQVLTRAVGRSSGLLMISYCGAPCSFPEWDAMCPGLCNLHLGHSFCCVCSVHQLDPWRPVTSPRPSSFRVFVDKTVEGRPGLFPVSQAPSFAVLLAELLEHDAAQDALELRDLDVRTPTDLWELCAKSHVWAVRMRVRSRSPRKAIGNTASSSSPNLTRPDHSTSQILVPSPWHSTSRAVREAALKKADDRTVPSPWRQHVTESHSCTLGPCSLRRGDLNLCPLQGTLPVVSSPLSLWCGTAALKNMFRRLAADTCRTLEGVHACVQTWHCIYSPLSTRAVRSTFQ